ncbi:MAG: hypothetical protein ABEJ95_06635 [Candidatus Nanohalobium sp.]
MGIFDREDDTDEVKISPRSGEKSESRLKDEVEDEIVDRNGSEKSSSRGKQIRERSNSHGKSTFGDDGVSLEDVHRQNKRIIELLEELNGEDSNTEEQDMEGDLNGVL